MTVNAAGLTWAIFFLGVGLVSLLAPRRFYVVERQFARLLFRTRHPRESELYYWIVTVSRTATFLVGGALFLTVSLGLLAPSDARDGRGCRAVYSDC